MNQTYIPYVPYTPQPKEYLSLKFDGTIDEKTGLLKVPHDSMYWEVSTFVDDKDSHHEKTYYLIKLMITKIYPEYDETLISGRESHIPWYKAIFGVKPAKLDPIYVRIPEKVFTERLYATRLVYNKDCPINYWSLDRSFMNQAPLDHQSISESAEFLAYFWNIQADKVLNQLEIQKNHMQFLGKYPPNSVNTVPSLEKESSE